MTFATWIPGLVVLVFGAIFGAIAAKLIARKSGASTDRDMTLRDLEERVEHAVNQLRDLQLQEARIDPTFYAEQRAELEKRAAEALRERDAVLSGKDVIDTGPDRPKRSAEAELTPALAWFDSHPWAATLAWIVGIGLVGGILVASVAIEQKPREPMTGAPMTGGGMEGGNDVASLLAQTRQALATQQFEVAEQKLLRIRALEPDNEVAQVYEAVLMAAAGDTTSANARLDKLTTSNPKLPDAWLFRGMMAMQAGNMDRMRESFTQFISVAPAGPQRDRIKAMLERSQ